MKAAVLWLMRTMSGAGALASISHESEIMPCTLKEFSVSVSVINAHLFFQFVIFASHLSANLTVGNFDSCQA